MTLSIDAVVSEAPREHADRFRAIVAEQSLESIRLTAEELGRVARAVATRADLLSDLLTNATNERWWLLLYRSASVEVKLQSWQLEQESDWHDHGGSSGAISVVSGSLVEHYRSTNFVDVSTRRFAEGQTSTFTPEHVHDVLFESGSPALSVHAYSPPLAGLTFYDRSPFGFVAREFIEEERRSDFPGARITNA